MARRTTRWRPDTCGCVIEYEWDDAVPAREREHDPVRVEPCPDHPALTDRHQLFAVVGDENRRKNLVWKAAVETIPELSVEKVGDDGEPYRVERLGRFQWAFEGTNADRVLHFVVEAGAPADRARHLAAVDRDFGAGARGSNLAAIEAIREARRNRVT